MRNIPKADIARILKKIDGLADNPRGEDCVKLSAQERYRVRQGLYRIVYEIRDEMLIVVVVKVGHRSAVYKNN